MAIKYDVVLNPGHGGSDPGAVVRSTKEKDITLVVGKSCRDELKRHGLKVLMTREKDESEGAAEIIRECNNSGAKVAVSFHLNVDAKASTIDDGAGDGFEVYYWETSSEGKKLAACMEKRAKALGQNSRGCKTANLFFTRETTMPAVLCELWFMDNKKDRAVGDTLAKQKAWGVEMAKGILDYLGIKWKEPKKEPVKVTSKAVYKVQVGAFSKKANAEKLKAELQKKGYSAKIVVSK